MEEALKPETQEIKDWFLFRGMETEIYEDYLICFYKSDAIERMNGRLTQKELGAIGNIITYFLEDGSGWQSSCISDLDDILDVFLCHAEKQECEIEVYIAALSIRIFASDNKLLERHADQVIHSEKCKDAVKKALKIGKGVILAKELDIPYQEQLLELMQEDFQKYYRWCNTLMKPEEGYADRVLEIYRQEMPPESIETDPCDTEEFGYEYEKALPIIFLLQNIGYYPGKGMDYLKRAIFAPAKRARAHALRVMTEWVTKKRLPLEFRYPELYKLLKEAYEAEKSSDLRKLMKRLLDGEYDFYENDVIDDEYDAETDAVNDY